MGAEEREDLMVIRRRIQQAGTIMSPSEYKLTHPDPFWETWAWATALGEVGWKAKWYSASSRVTSAVRVMPVTTTMTATRTAAHANTTRRRRHYG